MVKRFFRTVCDGPNFFIFRTLDREYFIAQAPEGKAPRIDDAHPILIRQADRILETEVAPYPLTDDTAAWITRTETETITEVFRNDIADLPPEAQKFLLERFATDLKDAEEFAFEFPETTQQN